MRVWELLIRILEECKGDAYLEVMLDAGAPRPFEKEFEIKNGKGFLLFCRRSGDKK
jgi:hypothetical protein